MQLIERVTNDRVLAQAYEWVCQRRLLYHYNNDVWQLRRWWDEKKPLIVAQLRAGTYRFREQRRVSAGGEVKEIWAAQDALVLKALAIVLHEELQPHLSRRCFHLAGTGGLKGAVREVAAHLPDNEFVFRTDVKGYYASINHEILFNLVKQYVQDEEVLDLVGQYLKRFVSDGGEYTDIEQGISLGCPLSPLMGALYLKPLDDRMAEMGCFYVRYMDDWVILAPTRWKLRKAIKAVNGVMADLRVVQHPDKTFIGRISRGFDFLGYWFSPSGLGVALKTVERCLEKVSRLYEQGASVGRIGEYLGRWCRWVWCGVAVESERKVESRVAPASFLSMFRLLFSDWWVGSSIPYHHLFFSFPLAFHFLLLYPGGCPPQCSLHLLCSVCTLLTPRSSSVLCATHRFLLAKLFD